MSLDGNAKAKNVIKGKVFEPDTIHGKSAYEIAVINGFKGTEAEWLASLKGADGKDGEKGEKGDMPDVSNFLTKQQSNMMTYEVYALSPYEPETKLEVSDNTLFRENEYRGEGIPYRQPNGNLLTDTPILELDCANKKYVDDLVGDIETLLGGI